MEKEPSASIKPDKVQGFILVCEKVENYLMLNWLDGILAR